MQPLRLEKPHTLAYSFSRVPGLPTENNTEPSGVMLTPQSGQTSTLGESEFDMKNLRERTHGSIAHEDSKCQFTSL